MKKYILLSLIVILSTNVLLIDEIPTSNEVFVQVSEEKKVDQIQPTGVWFVEEEIIDE